MRFIATHFGERPVAARFGVVAVRCVPAVLAAVLLCGMGAPCPAADSSGRAITSRAARDEAIQSIPFEKLSHDKRARINAIVNNSSLFRRLPLEVVDCDPDLFLFLIRNPEVVVDIWRIMGITNMTLDRTGADSYRASDGQGTTGAFEYAYRSGDLHVLYSEGTYEGSMYPAKLRGECVLVLKTAYVKQPNGHVHIVNRLDAFVHVDNLGIELIAKTLQPLLGKTADHNFAETSMFVGTLSHTAEANPAGVSRLAQKLVHVEAPIRQQFAELSGRVPDNVAGQAAQNEPAPTRAAPANSASARMRRSDTADIRER